jgi:uncharacterized protein (DUF924 family)
MRFLQDLRNRSKILDNPNMSKVQKILQFWFGPPEDPDYGSFQPWWFQGSAAVDHQIAERFSEDYEFAAAGYLEGWQGWPESCLALILLLDQMPRSLFRGQAKAFATDEMARSIAHQALLNKVDQELPIRNAVQRWFLYMPLQHSEVLADQERSLELFQSSPDHPAKAQAVASAKLHHWLIQEFGRFPHRNQLLDRPSTPAELAYLQQPEAFHG